MISLKFNWEKILILSAEAYNRKNSSEATMIDVHQIISLLSQVQTVNAHYKKINQLSGENFNVFRILKLESSEVRMHSAFIAELLNPQGSHGQGAIFLKMFVEDFCFKEQSLDFESCKVTLEKHTGFISENRTEGGRIDIFITDKHNNHIIIENKIYAGDQENQLFRYYKHSPKADLFYLTLDGMDPSETSRATLLVDKDFKCISYKTDITNWLQKCRKEGAVLPILRESITQYLNLVKYLTNQTTNDNMKDELSNIITSNIEASFLISNNLKSSLNNLLKNFDIEMEKIAEEYNLEYVNGVNLDKNYSGFWFHSPGWKYANIGFQFWSYDKKLVYGLSAKKDPNSFPTDLRSAIVTASSFSGKPNGWWPMYQPMEEPFDNWGKYEAWKAIEDGRMTNVFREKIKSLLELVKGMDL